MDLKAVIIDDELLARENMKLLLEDHCPEVTVVGTAGNVAEAIQVIEEMKPDVIFLDIRMPSGSEGFELLEAIPEKRFQVVFVTAFKDYAIRAFNANAVHYLLKPIDEDDLIAAVDKVKKYQEVFNQEGNAFDQYIESINTLNQNLKQGDKPKRITLFHSKGFKIVEDNEVVRLEASGNCTYLFFEDGSKYLDTKTLKIYEEILDETMFMRIHKSHIINLNYLREYINRDGHISVLKNGDHVPVSRARLSNFLSTVKRISA